MANVKVGTALRTQRGGANGTAASGLRGVSPGSQQQWFSRDSTVGAWNGAVWNMVFTGVRGAPPSHCGPAPSMAEGAAVASGPFTTVEATPIIAEKPYLTIDSAGQYQLQLPPVKTASSGSDFTNACATREDTNRGEPRG